jgi:hypothetical protein
MSEMEQNNPGTNLGSLQDAVGHARYAGMV